jgi:hypothetical protein
MLNPQMLGGFTVDTFSPLVGSAFDVHLDSATRLRLELIDAVSAGGAGATGRPFSLLFRGPGAPLAVQQIYQVEHPTLGSFELFLVPVGPDEHGMCYEAVFN